MAWKYKSYIIKRSNNMKNNETLITAEGLEELKAELDELKLVKRKEISKKSRLLWLLET